MENKHLPEEQEISGSQIRRRTFFAFLVFGLANVAGFGAWRWLNSQALDKGVLKPLRSVFGINEKVNNSFFSNQHLAREYPKNMAAKKVRMNGRVGIQKNPDPEMNMLQIIPHPDTLNSGIELKVAELASLPKKEIIFEFKCIEGWSQVSHWGGCLFSDFLQHYNLGVKNGKTFDTSDVENFYKYVGLVTPDKKYYAGIDMKSMMHPQTILAYEMNDKPLLTGHGAPLRLIIPVKYGVKNLKCIGAILFSDTRPPDYWHERGYDYDCAL